MQRLIAHGINPLHAMRANVVARAPLKTLARGSGLGPESSLLTFRRRHLLALNSIEHGTRWVRFEGRDRNSWPRLARQVRGFLAGLAASGAFGKDAELQPCEVVCDERLHTPDELADGIVHCLISLPALRVGDYRTYLLTHRRDGSSVRPALVAPAAAGHASSPCAIARSRRRTPASMRASMQASTPPHRDARWRRSCSQPVPDQRPAATSDVRRPEAAAARRLDPDLIARLYGEPERSGERF